MINCLFLKQKNLNHYPPHFIAKQFNRFFHLNNAMPVLIQLNEHVYQQLHQPTRREKKLNTMMENPVENPLALQPKIWNKELMYPRYLFDSSLTIHLPQQFHKWWKTYYAFSGSPFQHIKVILVTNTNPALEPFFIHKKPRREILTKMETI